MLATLLRNIDKPKDDDFDSSGELNEYLSMLNEIDAGKVYFYYAHQLRIPMTEPQYFEWVKKEINPRIRKYGSNNIVAIILEVNQTNTPCSGKQCRPAILDEWLVAFQPLLCRARMSAYKMYENQPPKVGLTSFEAEKLKKQQKGPPTIAESAVVHRIPEKSVVL